MFNLIARDSSQTDKLTLFKGDMAVHGYFKRTKYRALLLCYTNIFFIFFEYKIENLDNVLFSLSIKLETLTMFN